MLTHGIKLSCLLAMTALISNAARGAPTTDPLERGFVEPPQEAKLRAYWWWLNGNVTKAAITRDLEEMAAKGFGGALICDAGGAEQDGNDRVPHGPTFFTPEWRELYKHALHEADRLGLEMSLNIQSGWNLGGPMIKAQDAPKRLVWSETRVSGPAELNRKLKEPKHPPQFYRDVAVVAYRSRSRPDAASQRQPLQLWQEKALHRVLGRSAPDTSPLMQDLPDRPGEEDVRTQEVVDLTDRLNKEGVLVWSVPDGEWEILRFGCTLNQHCRVSTCSDGWQGYALDPFDANVFRAYWQEVVEPLIADAGPLAGRTLKYLHTDSWEVEVANWTPTLREEFQRRRGYDMWPFLPTLAGRIVNSRSLSNRFLNDLRKTIGDLAVDNHFRLFREFAHKHGLLIHPESGGPHAVPIDSLRCLGMNDAPMSEFWARSWRHRVTDEDRFFVKQPASAAHTYGHKLVLAEGFTTIGPHWQETLWDNLKPSFDRAACEGLNLLVWHAFTCSPPEMGLPGQEYFAGTHFNPNSTWWSRSTPFLAYINRSQFLLQQGLFVADAIYYYGDHVPNFAQLRESDPAHVAAGYDYDVATEEVILTRMSVRDGRIVLPDGMSYRVLVLPDRRSISLPVLRKLKELVSAGATIIGPKPDSATSLQNYPKSDEDVARLAGEVWGDCDGKTKTEHRVGRGRVIWGKTARQVLLADDVKPDFEYTIRGVVLPATNESQPAPVLDYIHRYGDRGDIYFVCNRTDRIVEADVRFRVAGRIPELWDPLTGQIRTLAAYAVAEDRTTVPLQFTPYASWFVVFRKESESREAGTGASNFPKFDVTLEITGPWTVGFDPQWGGPESAEFTKLESWTTRPEDGIRFYSGTATYVKTFDLPQSQAAGRESRIYLDLGDVRQLAEVRLNGKECGIVWAPPFRVDVTEVLQPTGNRIEVEVVNFWSNRVIGDQSLPPEQRRTRSNIRKLTAKTPLAESGLLGPVTLQTAR